MAEDKHDPNAAVWAALTKRIVDLEQHANAANGAHNSTVAFVNDMQRAFQHNIDIIHHLLRTARNVSFAEWQKVVANAAVEMANPPQMDETAMLRRQMEDMAREMASLKSAMNAKPVELAPPVAKRKHRAVQTVAETPTLAQEQRTRPNPADYAPAVIVAPPALVGDDDVPPVKRPDNFRVPPTMRFGEGM